jgi:hypothetical protein
MTKSDTFRRFETFVSSIYLSLQQLLRHCILLAIQISLVVLPVSISGFFLSQLSFACLSVRLDSVIPGKQNSVFSIHASLTLGVIFS